MRGDPLHHRQQAFSNSTTQGSPPPSPLRSSTPRTPTTVTMVVVRYTAEMDASWERPRETLVVQPEHVEAFDAGESVEATSKFASGKALRKGSDAMAVDENGLPHLFTRHNGQVHASPLQTDCTPEQPMIYLLDPAGRKRNITAYRLSKVRELNDLEFVKKWRSDSSSPDTVLYAVCNGIVMDANQTMDFYGIQHENVIQLVTSKPETVVTTIHGAPGGSRGMCTIARGCFGITCILRYGHKVWRASLTNYGHGWPFASVAERKGTWVDTVLDCTDTVRQGKRWSIQITMQEPDGRPHITRSSCGLLEDPKTGTADLIGHNGTPPLPPPSPDTMDDKLVPNDRVRSAEGSTEELFVALNPVLRDGDTNAKRLKTGGWL